VLLTPIRRTSFRSTERDLAAYPFTFERRDTTTLAVSRGPRMVCRRGA